MATGIIKSEFNCQKLKNRCSKIQKAQLGVSNMYYSTCEPNLRGKKSKRSQVLVNFVNKGK